MSVPNPSEGAARAITCREVVECTTTYLEVSLLQAARASMDVHLASCTGCRAYVDQMASLREALKALPGPAMGPAQRLQLRRAYAMRRFD
jgi:predicted anti-sigma-YlaC factor YlaD